MLSNALALALLTTAGMMVVYKKLPRKVRRLIEKFSLVADILALLGVYWMFGSTLTALVAGALAGLFTSALLHIANNPEDFLFLADLSTLISKQLTKAKEFAHEWGKRYNETRVQSGDLPEPEIIG